MIVITATTESALKYLTLYELENYKKQFQSFWIPFMEQFIPATTIWVAGERWCNEPCTIIDPCDYDFELVASASTIQTVVNKPNITTISTYGNSVGFVPPEKVSVSPPPPIIGTIPDKSPDLLNTSDLGETFITENVLTQSDTDIDITQYRNKFISLETIVL